MSKSRPPMYVCELPIAICSFPCIRSPYPPLSILFQGAPAPVLLLFVCVTDIIVQLSHHIVVVSLLFVWLNIIVSRIVHLAACCVLYYS
jgi:hypothetical protein